MRKGGGRWRRGRRGSGAESKAESRRQSRERAREQVCSYGWRIQSVRTWWRNVFLLGLKVGILVAKPFTRCGEQTNLLRTRERGVLALGKVWIFSFWCRNRQRGFHVCYDARVGFVFIPKRAPRICTLTLGIVAASAFFLNPTAKFVEDFSHLGAEILDSFIRDRECSGVSWRQAVFFQNCCCGTDIFFKK